MSGRTRAQHWASFDYIGLGLWMPAIVCLILILQLGGQKYSWSSGAMIALYVLTPLLFAAYVFRQWKAGDDALTPARIMSQRTMIVGCLYMLFISCIETQIPYFLPIYFQTALGKTALESGVATLPTLLALIVFFIIAGAGTSISGYYVPFMLVGSAVLSVGAGLLSTFSSTTSPGRWIGYQIVAAAGLGTGFDAPQIAAQAAFGKGPDVTIALVIITSCMNIGGSVGVSIGTVILNSRVVALLSGISAQANFSSSGLTAVLDSLSAAERTVVANIYGIAIQDVYHSTTALAVVTFILACFMDWLSVKEKPENANAEAGAETEAKPSV